MELVYLWIDKYKNIENLGISLNSQYIVTTEYKDTTNSLNIIEIKNNNKINIFGESINLQAIVGANGSGKTTILEILFYILSNNAKDIKYSLIVKNNESNKFEHLSNNISIITSENINIIPLNEYMKFLFCQQFKKNNIKKKAYTNYDTELSYQDKINNYLYYDRFDDNEVKMAYGYTINFLENSKFLKEHNYLKFNSFLWDFDLYSCYEYIVYRLKNAYDGKLKEQDEKFKNYNYTVFAYLNHKYVKEFLNIVNKIVPFTTHKRKTTNYFEYLFDEIFPDVIFFSAILEFATFLNSIYESLHTIALYEYENKQTEYIDVKQNSIDEIFIKIINICEEKEQSISKVEFLNYLLDIINNNNLSYNKFINKNDKSFNYGENFSKYIHNINNLEECKTIFNKYFEQKKSTDIFKLKSNYYIETKYYNREIEESINKKSTYITEYINLPNEAIKTICKTFATRFLVQFLNINFCNKTKNGNEYNFSDLSTGEQRIIKFMADIAYCNTRDVYLIDEMDLSWHPTWQKNMIYYLTDIVEKKAKLDNKITNIIIATHSPLVLSDIPRENILLLNRDKNTGIASVIYDDIQTFGANVHSLFENSFFLDTNMGRIAQNKIEEVLKKIKNIKQKPNQIKNNNIEELKNLIRTIGEPVIQYQLLKELYSADSFINNSSDNLARLQLENDRLNKELKVLKNKYEKNNNS